MIDKQAVYIANGAAVVLLLTLILSSRRTLHHRFLDERLFSHMVLATILQSIAESAAYMVDGIPLDGYRTVALLINAFLFLNNIFFAFTWTMYADYKLFEDVHRIKKIYPFVGIPAILVGIGSVVNLFTPVFFSISADNVYQRTGLFALPFLLTYLYLAYGVVLIYQNKNKVNKYLFMPALLFMCPILLASLLQYFFYGLSLIWLGAAIALVSLYINVQNEVSYIDPLSELYTRSYMNQYLDTEIRHLTPTRHLAGIMLDIDQFKKINDGCGHLTGDEAIQSAGKILHRSALENEIAIRFAGDEFIVLRPIDDEQEIRDTMQRIRQNAEEFNACEKKPYHITFSMGYAVYDPQKDTMDSFLHKMDLAMYADKRSKIKNKILPERRNDAE